MVIDKAMVSILKPEKGNHMTVKPMQHQIMKAIQPNILFKFINFSIQIYWKSIISNKYWHKQENGRYIRRDKWVLYKSDWAIYYPLYL